MDAGRRLAVALLAIATAAMLAWVVAQIDGARFVSALRAVRPAWLALAIAWFGLSLLARTWRLAVLLPSRQRFVDLLGVMVLGSLAMNVLPLRAGELVRPWILADRHHVPWGESLGALAAERVLDLCGLLSLVLLTGALVDVSGRVVLGGVDVLDAGFTAMAVTAAVGIGAVVSLAVVGEAVRPAMRRVLGMVSDDLAATVDRQWTALVGALRELRSPRRLGLGALSTAVSWGTTLAFTWAMVAAVEGAVPWTHGLLTWTVAGTAMVLFPSPGFLGAFEAAVVAALGLVGVDPSHGGAVAVLLHGHVIGLYALGSVWAVGHTGVGWRDVLSAPVAEDGA